MADLKSWEIWKSEIQWSKQKRESSLIKYYYALKKSAKSQLLNANTASFAR